VISDQPIVGLTPQTFIGNNAVNDGTADLFSSRINLEASNSVQEAIWRNFIFNTPEARNKANFFAYNGFLLSKPRDGGGGTAGSDEFTWGNMPRINGKSLTYSDSEIFSSNPFSGSGEGQGPTSDPFQNFGPLQFPSDLLNPNYFDDSGKQGAIFDPVNYAEFGMQGGLDFAGNAGGTAADIAGLGYSSYLASSSGGFSDDWGLSYLPGYTSNDTFDTSDIYNYYSGGDYYDYSNNYNYDDLYNYVDYSYDDYGSYLDSNYGDYSYSYDYSDFGGYGDFGSFAPVVARPRRQGHQHHAGELVEQLFRHV
jgi:hypothetical protein